MLPNKHQGELTIEQELNSILRAWRRMRARVKFKQRGPQRRTDEFLVQARSGLMRARTGVLLFVENKKQRARFEQCLDEIRAAFDTADATIPRAPRQVRPPHREADLSLNFLIDGCREVARRHGVNEQRIARFVIQQAPKLTVAERAVIFSAEPHRPKAEQMQEAEKRFIDRLRPHRAGRQTARRAQ